MMREITVSSVSETIKTCLQDDKYNKVIASMEHSCKFLPYSSAEPSCHPVFKGNA
jgi:hypothetical protein